MAEKTTTVYERADDEKAREFFARYGHVALADAYDSSLAAPAASMIINRTRLHANDVLGGQVANISDSYLRADNPVGLVAISALARTRLLGDTFGVITMGDLRAHVIDQRGEAEGGWHKDSGIIVGTIEGSSRFEISGNEDNVEAAYDLTPGRIVVMDPARRLLHRGVATSRSSRMGLVIAKVR